jgi:hypothetical protein
VQIADFTVVGKLAGAGVMVDSAARGAVADWNYVASRGVRIDRLSVDNCDMGIHLLARPGQGADPKFTAFDVRVTDAAIRGCTNWGVRVESLGGATLTGFELDNCEVQTTAVGGGNGGVGLGNADDVKLGGIAIRHPRSVVAFEARNASGLSIDRLQVDITGGGGAAQPTPCVFFDESRAILNDVQVQWPAAPAYWRPIRVTNYGVGCGADSGPPPVTIRNLGVQPTTVTAPVMTC